MVSIISKDEDDTRALDASGGNHPGTKSFDCEGFCPTMASSVRFQSFGLCICYRKNESRKMKSEQQEVYEFLVFVISQFGTRGQPEPTVGVKDTNG